MSFKQPHLITVPLIYKVDVPNLIAYLNRTPIFVWYVVSVVSRMDTHKKRDTFSKEIGLHAQNMVVVLGIIEGNYYDNLG